MHPTWIEVDLAQLQKNIDWIRERVGGRKICLPVKANAYGHGLCLVGKGVEVDCLGVSCLQEGVRLRQSGVTKPILVLGAIHEDQIESFLEYNLEFTISSRYKADLVAKKARGGCRVHLEVETGMQRTGVRPETALELMKYLKQQSCFEVVGVYSHLATSDEAENGAAQKQIETFQKLVQDPIFSGIIPHLANSGGVLHYPNAYFQMVRPGLLAYGYGPGVKPCFSLKSRVSYFKVVPAGVGISYGHTYVTKKQTRVVTIPVGYGDGYRRALSNRGSVLIRGKKYFISGAICMDQFMVDVGDDEVYVGDEVVLIGKQGSQEIRLEEVADLCQTIPYEILSSFNERIPRFKHGEL
jgi:alanine racemase